MVVCGQVMSQGALYALYAVLVVHVVHALCAVHAVCCGAVFARATTGGPLARPDLTQRPGNPSAHGPWPTRQSWGQR
ncbi:hypothetical protein GCM10027075_74490 [Streptomyces heilongjiangensis]